MDFNVNLQKLTIMFVPFVMAVVFHEFAHGYIANRWGDSTAKDEGRLTLNPVPHMDMIGTVFFPLIMMLTGSNFLFGWAKPVPINPTRFKKYRAGLFWVSLAGPGMNFILAAISALFYGMISRFLQPDFYLYEPLIMMAETSVFLNFSLAIFNLIPIPPLDGSKIVMSFLSYNKAQKYELLSQYSFFILMGLILSGALRFLSYPILFLGYFTLRFFAGLFGIAYV